MRDNKLLLFLSHLSFVPYKVLYADQYPVQSNTACCSVLHNLNLRRKQKQIFLQFIGHSNAKSLGTNPSSESSFLTHQIHRLVYTKNSILSYSQTLIPLKCLLNFFFSFFNQLFSYPEVLLRNQEYSD